MSLTPLLTAAKLSITDLTRVVVSNGLSANTISPKTDKIMDKKAPMNGTAAPGVSIRNGPVEEKILDARGVNGSLTNGDAKRKSRGRVQKSSYKDASDDDEEDDIPLVRSRCGVIDTGC